MKMKSLLASMAVASLAIAQPVAAATRSADSLPQRGVQSLAPADRIGSITGEAEAVGNEVAIGIVIFLLIVIIWGVAGNNKSRG